MKLLRHPFILVLFIVTFFDAPSTSVTSSSPRPYLSKGVGIQSNWVMPIMSIGQIAEIVTMAFLGYVLKTLGWRNTMVIGILGHAVRFAVFAFFPDRDAGHCRQRAARDLLRLLLRHRVHLRR